MKCNGIVIAMCQSDLRRNSPPRPNEFGGIEEERRLSNGKWDQFVEEKKTKNKETIRGRKEKKKRGKKERKGKRKERM